MKLTRLISAAILAALFAAALPMNAAAASFQAEKKRVGVVPFQNNTQWRGADVGQSLADVLVSELMANRNYELIERSRLEQVLEEQGLSLTGLIDQSDAPLVGKIQGLDYIVFGTVVEASAAESTGSTVANVAAGVLSVLGGKSDKGNADTISKVASGRYTAKVAVNVKVVNVETGQIVISETGEGRKTFSGIQTPSDIGPGHYSEAARQAVARAAFKIMIDIAPMEATVLLVKMAEKEVTIDLGRDAGIQEGQRFAIIREGELLHDRSGNLIGVDITEIAYITIKRVETSTAVGKIVKINKDKEARSNYEIKRGDLVRPQDRLGKSRGMGDRFGGK